MEQTTFNHHESVFLGDTKQTSYPTLEQDMHVDVAIIGGGIVGVTLAYLLKHSGQKVALFEADRIAKGMTVKSTAKLTLQHHLIYDRLVHTKSPGRAKQYADANNRAITFVKELVKKEHMDCDLVEVPSYVYTTKEENVRKIKDELEACKRLGIEMKYRENLPINLPIKAALEWEEAALFHPRKYLLHLAKDFVEAGGKIYENTRIQSVIPHKKGDNEEVTLETEGGKRVAAQKVVIASHFPIYDGMGLYFSRLNMRRIYVVAAKVKASDLPRGSFISADEPKYSIRPIYEKNLVLIGGAEHRTGVDEKELIHFEELRSFAHKVFHANQIEYYWSTQDYVTTDQMPYIGYLNSSLFHNLYVATGFNKWGMTGGINAALVLRDMLLMGRSDYEELFNPKRTGAMSGPNFMTGFNKWGMTGGINAALVLRDMLLMGRSDYEELFNPKRTGAMSGPNFMTHNTEAVKNYLQGKLRMVPKQQYPQKGEAVVTKLEDGNVYGIYQDEEENYHIVELTCPHVGARLRWNSAEKSWDCPVHGSRFSIDGEILDGPSTHRLNSYKEGKNQIHPNLY